MSIIKEIEKGLSEAKLEYKEIFENIRKRNITIEDKLVKYEHECYGQIGSNQNIFFWGDNIDFIRELLESDIRGKVQLVYIDPPFFSKAKYEVSLGYKGFNIKDIAYTDIFSKGLCEYIKMLALRFFAIKELLSDTGCVWVHLDWHSSHYIKIVMDEIFGEKNFVNEIIWAYKSGGSSRKSFSKKHDTLLFYSKTGGYYIDIPKEKSYNRDFKPYKFKNVEEFEDEVGWYTMVNMKDVWQIDMVGRTSKERTGYRTQKPENLMARIIESCSKPGDICIDLFSGSGSFPITCAMLDRRWFASDFGKSATNIIRKRMLQKNMSFSIAYKNNKKVRKILDISIERFQKTYIIKLQGLDSEKFMELEQFTKYKNSFDDLPFLMDDSYDKLIDFWGVYKLKGKRFYELIFYSTRDKNGNLEKKITVEIQDLGKDEEYFILASDVFGNIYEKEIETEGL